MWPNDLVNWAYITNISHKQKNYPNNARPLVDVLKVAAKNRLRQKGLKAETHIEDFSKEKAYLKRKKRNIHAKDFSAEGTNAKQRVKT